jgi:hypothetical protein
MVPKLPYGEALEAGAGLVSGAVAPAVAGITGLAGSVLPGPEGQGADWVKETQDALTYEPQSKNAQMALHLLGLPGEYLAKGANAAGEWTAEKTGSPLIGSAVNTGINAIPLLLGTKMPGAKVSTFERALPGGELPSTPGARAKAQAAALTRDADVAAAQDAGYKLPPGRINPDSFWNKTLETIGGKAAGDRGISEANQPVTQAKARREAGLAVDEPINLDTLSASRDTSAAPYREVAKAVEGAPYTEVPPRPGTGPGTGIPAEVVTPGMEITPEFRAKVGSEADRVRAKIAEDPEAFKSLEPSLKLLDSALRKSEMNPDFVVDRITQLRSDAKKGFESRTASTVEKARTQLDLANNIEALVEQNLKEKGDVGALTRFREARTKIAKTYDVEKATLATGEVSAKAIADSRSRGTKISGELGDIADLGSKYPEAAQIPSRAPTTAINPMDLGLAILGHTVNPAGIASKVWTGVRAPVRAILKSDAYQKGIRPQYSPSYASKLVKGLQQEGVVPGLESLGLSEHRKELLRQLLEEGAPQ